MFVADSVGLGYLQPTWWSRL